MIDEIILYVRLFFLVLFLMNIFVKVGFERDVKVGFSFCIVEFVMNVEFWVRIGLGFMWMVKFCCVVVGIVKVVFCCVWLNVFLLFLVVLKVNEELVKLV